jgi:hypothetical protein
MELAGGFVWRGTATRLRFSRAGRFVAEMDVRGVLM